MRSGPRRRPGDVQVAREKQQRPHPILEPLIADQRLPNYAWAGTSSIDSKVIPGRGDEVFE